MTTLPPAIVNISDRIVRMNTELLELYNRLPESEKRTMAARVQAQINSAAAAVVRVRKEGEV